jgi:hypothetical protein
VPRFARCRSEPEASSGNFLLGRFGGTEFDAANLDRLSET